MSRRRRGTARRGRARPSTKRRPKAVRRKGRAGKRKKKTASKKKTKPAGGPARATARAESTTPSRSASTPPSRSATRPRAGSTSTQRPASAAGPGTSSRAQRTGWAAYRPMVMPLVVMCMALFLFACYRETKPEKPAVTEQVPAEEPRVRIALVEGAAEIEVNLAGSWKIEARSGDDVKGVAVFGPVALTLRKLPQGGLQVVGVTETHDFPGASELALKALSAPGDEPQDTVFELDGRTYRGDLRLGLTDAGSLKLINSIGIEDYLPCVIGHEMPISWSDSALHAQAIAARTYALATLKPHADYDLFADTRSQVYRGVIAEDAKARRIVEETRGMVVTWNGDLVVTYFHSTCGGDTVPASWVFSWVKDDTAPLMGAQDCTCQPSKFYRWTQEVDLNQAVNELVLELPLKSVVVDHWPRGEYVKQVHFTDASGEVTTASGWDTRRIFGLKGYSFDVALAADGRGLTFEGRGWGHGVGMCQFGAQGFSKQGWTGKQILEHFYPSAEVESLGY